MGYRWPNNFPLDQYMEQGFSDQDLERLCDRQSETNRGSIPFPRIFSFAELYGMGFATRVVANLPRLMPIPYFSDHGVHHTENWDRVETSNFARTHMTWHEWRAGQDLSPRRVVRITHPLVIFRRRRRIYRKSDASGSLVFLDHSRPGYDFKPYDYEKYFEKLASLPSQMRPKGVCIQMHDIHKGLHKTVRPFGIPLFTVGESSSNFFAERFYDLISRFEFATSTRVSSHSYLTEEAGVRFFLWGEEISPKTDRPQLLREFEDHLLEHAKKVFSDFPPRRTFERYNWLNSTLSLDIGLDESVRRIRRTVQRDLLYALLVGVRSAPAYLTKWAKRKVQNSKAAEERNKDNARDV